MNENEGAGNQELRELIFEEIRREGRITFARFMELDLYHPRLGYYMSDVQRVGKQGDFYTSPHVNPMFGQLLARQIEEMWRVSGMSQGFDIVEFGAGSGLLAMDILRAMSPDFLDAARYSIVEINPYMVEAQRQRLNELHLPEGKVEWRRKLEDIVGGGRVGCILSNELIDAFPVHRVKRKGRKLREIYVGLKGERFVEFMDEPSNLELEAYLVKNGIKLVDGQEIEVNLQALEWLEEVARFLSTGFVLTVDYGYESRDLPSPRFFNGSLMAYRRHKVSHDPYEAIGMQDLTSHVNFTALMNRGEEVGLATTGYTTQMNFLLALALGNREVGDASGLGVLGEAGGGAQIDSYRDAIALKQLMMPGGMGEVFKVLVQHKGLERPDLTGLRKPW